MARLTVNKYYDKQGTFVIHLKQGEKVPNFGISRCPHPQTLWIYIEWDASLGTGHGWACVGCGEIVQVG